MYRVVEINNLLHVLDEESGCTIRYKGKGKHTCPTWKYDVFKPWLQEMTTKQRKEVYWNTYGNKEKEKEKKAVMEMMRDMYYDDVKQATGGGSLFTNPTDVTLAPLPCVKTQSVCKPCECKEQPTKKKAKTMQYYDEDGYLIDTPVSKSDEQTKRDYLLDRIDQIVYAVHARLQNMFNLKTNATPYTMEDFFAAIKNGNYTVKPRYIKDEDGEPVRFWNVSELVSRIKWLPSPDKLPDEKGFEAAVAEFEKARQAAKDLAALGDISDATKAMQALENWTPTGKAN